MIEKNTARKAAEEDLPELLAWEREERDEMIGVEARDLRVADEILGLGVVTRRWRDPDGEIAVAFAPGGRMVVAPDEYVAFVPSAYLRIVRPEASAHG